MAAGYWHGITIDCRDVQDVASFWSTLLGRPVVDHLPGWRKLDDDSGSAPRIAFQPVPEPKCGKNRIHLDLTVDALDEVTALVTSLGGRLTGERHEYAEGIVAVATDPEDNEFCLTQYFRHPAPSQTPDEGSAT